MTDETLVAPNGEEPATAVVEAATTPMMTTTRSSRLEASYTSTQSYKIGKPFEDEDMYDEIVIEEDEDETQYIDEILLDDDYFSEGEEEFTEVTCASNSHAEDVHAILGQHPENGGGDAEPGEPNGDDAPEDDDEYVEIEAEPEGEAEAPPLTASTAGGAGDGGASAPQASGCHFEQWNASNHSTGSAAGRRGSQVPRKGSVKRPVIKSVAQKNAELEAAAKDAEEEHARVIREQILAKQRELEALNERERLARLEEEEEMARIAAEREEKRKEKERRASQIAAAEIAKQIAHEDEEEKKRFRQEEEDRRKAEEEKHRIAAAAKAAAMKEAAERARKEAEAETARQAAAKQKRLEEEASRLQGEMDKARKAAEAAKQKEEEEKKRLQAKIKERRAAAKERLAKASRAVQNKDEDTLPSMFAASQKAKPVATSAAPAAVLTDDVTSFYSIEQLRAQSIPGLDYKNREKYLSDAEFMSIFECTKEEYAGFPGWKRTNLKRKAKLF